MADGQEQQARDALLDATQTLFMERGYEPTTKAQIEQTAGLPEGSFGRHFDSKSAAARAMAQRMAAPVLGLLELYLEDEALSAVDRLNAFFEVAASWKWGNEELVHTLIEGLLKEENLALRHHLNEVFVDAFVPLLTQIVAQGRSEGVFEVVEPEDTAELLLLMMNGVRMTMVRHVTELQERPWAFKEIQRKSELLFQATERILGAPAGSLRRMDVGYLESIVSRLEEPS